LLGAVAGPVDVAIAESYEVDRSATVEERNDQV
jgi:hypothetical protein